MLYEKESVGKRIGQLRKSYGMSREEMAEITGKSVKHYSDIERGTVGMSLETLLVISSCFKVPADYILLGGSGRQTEGNQKMAKDAEEWRALELLRHLPPAKRTSVLQSMEVFAEALANGSQKI